MTLTTGEVARNEVLEKVEEPTLTDQLENWLNTVPSGTLLTGEDIRIQSGIVAPPHAYGPSINGLRHRDVLEKTGERRPMQSEKSHGRETAVWRVL